ncbi:MmgE/PrpD family protein [Micromonospora sp. NPDC049048]|uniref:MmgE/PrpD family protein n=1 Tax=Micromonospora sp. NPDC049048 TaxID=3364263 RepID=UPI003715440A
MSRTLLEQLVTRLAATVGAGFPSAVRDRAALCVLDSVACAIGGQDLPSTRAAQRAAARIDGAGPVPLWGTALTTSLTGAVFANAVAAHGLIHEDMHPASRVHAGTVVIPAALAVAGELDTPVERLLDAVVLGYEAIGQLGDVFDQPAFVRGTLRPSGVLGPFGAAVAVGHLLDLPPDQLVAALAIASSASGGATEWARAGTSDVFAQNALAARGGVQAAFLAAEGLTGPRTAIEGPAGMLAALRLEAGELPTPAPTSLAIDAAYFKRFPACAFTQETVLAGQRLRESVDPASIRALRIESYDMAAYYPGCDNADSLDDPISRQMSNQFNLAATLVDGAPSPSRLLGPLPAEIRRLAQVTSVRSVPELAAQYPARPASRVVATLDDGSVHSAEASGVGLSADEVVEKYRRYSHGRLTTAQAERFRSILFEERGRSSRDLVAPLQSAAEVSLTPPEETRA